jgi:uncharacterized protein (DUF58 family)
MFKRSIYKLYRGASGLTFRFGRRVTVVGWLVLGAMMVAAALGLDTNLSLAYQTFSLLFCLVVGSAIAASIVRFEIAAERILPRFGSVGTPLNYTIVLRNTSRRVQRGLFVQDDMQDPRPSFEEFMNTPEPGEEKRNWFDREQAWYRWQWLIAKNRAAQIEEKSVPSLAAKGKAEFSTELIPLRRGFLRFTTMNVSCPDPFGLFRSAKKLSLPQSILVLPKRYALPPIALPGNMKYQQGGVALASSVGESEEFVSLRDYRPGDPLRHIHWKSFAKTGRPIVKEFQDEFFVRHALILDTFDVHAHSEVFEEAVSVAASFAYTIQTQDSLLDLMFVGPQAYCFTSGRGVGHMEQMLEILASVQVCHERSFESLEQLVLQHISTVSGCICVFVCWDEQRRDFVEQLKALGLPILVLVVTETETKLEPGPMADRPECFRQLPVGKIGEELTKLSSLSRS